MDKPILPDTDVLVDFLRGYKPAVSFVKDHCDQIVLSSIVVAELYAGIANKSEEAVLDELVKAFRVAPVTMELAKAGGLLKREYGRSHGVGLADAILAATAQFEGADLKTLNVMHYPMMKGLKPAYEKR